MQAAQGGIEEIANRPPRVFMKTLHRISLFLIVFFFFTSFTVAQRRRGTAPKTQSTPTVQRPVPTFENVLATDTYRLYVEVRGVGQLLKTPAFNDLIEPLMKVASPPIAFKTLLEWLHSQTDSLTTSRLMVAAWSARPKVPNLILAIEFATPEEAQKFETRLKTFLPKILPTPALSSSSSEPKFIPERRATLVADAAPRREEGDKAPITDPEARETSNPQSKELLPSFVTKQAGALVFVSDRTFTFKNLRPSGSKLLTEHPDFRRVHDRFATESILVYFDSGAVEREEEERRRNYEKEHAKLSETVVAIPSAPENDQQEMQTPPDVQPEPLATPATVDPDVIAQAQLETSQQTSVQIDETSQRPPGPDIGTQLISRMANVLFSGKSNWPGAIGAALSFDPDSYALRLLLATEPGAKANPIPFMPQLISGPALTPEASALFPADTEFFVTVSLDYSQIYESMAKAFAEQAARAGMTVSGEEGFEFSPFAAFESKSGIKLKDDLIPLLGNEVALMLPLKTLDVGPDNVAAPSPAGSDGEFTSKGAAPPIPNPVVAIGIRDREGVRALIPKLIEALGFKGASLLAQTEKRGDTEVVSYADALSYAFIGNFLVISTNPKGIRSVVDAYLTHDTLASETQFRNFTRWQPRQVLGQFYLSPKLVESYHEFARSMDTSISTQLGDLLSRLSPTAEPLTYALSNEGLGPMHELRIPKNLALLMLASMFGVSSRPAAPTNEAMAQGTLRTVASAQATYRATSKDGSFGSKDQLVEAGLIPKHVFERSGYRIELSVSGSRFEASAVPLEYGKTGKLSFFVDESNVIRAGDHGGGPATVADKPFQ